MFATIRKAILPLLCCALPGTAFAADLAQVAPAPTAEEAIAAASPWMIRVRALGVLTHDSGTINGVPGAGLSYSDTVIPELSANLQQSLKEYIETLCGVSVNAIDILIVPTQPPKSI